jgi:hypothetical protein
MYCLKYDKIGLTHDCFSGPDKYVFVCVCVCARARARARVCVHTQIYEMSRYTLADK